MDIKEKLHTARQEYIEKYKTNPNVIFVSNNLINDLRDMVGGLNFYEAAPKHLWGADVIMVLSPDYIKFAEDSDIRKAIKRFNADKSWDSYKIEKTKTTIGGVGPGQHVRPQVINLEPIEFSKEEIEIYEMQT
ncbi:hypothetical protein ACFODO_07515 [Acinetobacter sichuanensis]|uniref:Uncharacterized protein n=1 Tax=Acinetobacter sichuanensis TaxID=2136183 RepID=A0A371YIK2_9GAMM|nr:hypothetical protein [Acinetobacter sichuanensis]RFC81301.1 hypothetical protein C9E89_022605 [Acinetobacter sichuanensis]